MPLGGILIALFMGWKVSRSEISRILNHNRFAVMFFMISNRFIAPIGVLIVMIFGIIHGYKAHKKSDHMVAFLYLIIKVQ